MWSIGDLRLEDRVVLGPMSGYTTRAYRRFMERFGVATSVTEMVSAQGLMHNPWESERFVLASDSPTGIQIFGGDPEVLASAAVRAIDMEPSAGYIDINMGCPVRKVVSRGAGSAMLSDPALCGRAVRAVKDATGMPVTAKIRLGETKAGMNFREVLDELVRAGADAVTVHARTASQRYAGSADHTILRDLQSEIPVPLIVSGDIYTAEDAKAALDISGAAGVMVARGGVGNPFLVTQINRLLRTGDLLPNPTVGQQAEWCLELMDAVIEESGERIALGRMRSLAPKFLSGCRYSRDYRRALTDGDTDLDSMRSLIERVRNEIGDAVVRPRNGCAPDQSD